jgi:hypothetical protein
MPAGGIIAMLLTTKTNLGFVGWAKARSDEPKIIAAEEIGGLASPGPTYVCNL